MTINLDESSPALPDIRPKRAPRVRKDLQHMADRMHELTELGLKCDPIQVLMEIASGQKLQRKVGTSGDSPSDYELIPVVGGYDKEGNIKEVDAATRAKAASELMSYMFPKRKAVEITGNEGTPITFAIQADNAPLPRMPEQADAPKIIDAETPILDA